MEVQLPLLAQIIAALSGTLGGIGGIIAIIRLWQRDKWEKEHAGKKTDANATTALTTSAMAMVNELQERVDKLHGRIGVLEEQKERVAYELECVKRENRELKIEMELVRAALRERDERIGELEVENKTLKGEVARLEARVKELESGRHTG